ncbi:MAG: hypothetical protein ACJ78Q_09125 [Chloroflexia bacterium]
MTFALLIPDGVGTRNFVLGPFLRHASAKGQVHTLHTIPNDLLPIYSAELSDKVQWHTLNPYHGSRLSLFLSEALAYGHMVWADTGAMRLKVKAPVKGSFQTRAMTGATRAVGRAAASPRRIKALDRWHSSVASRLPEVEPYRQLFRKIKPSVLFCSHQRPSIIIPPVLAARSLGIPTATFIFSWDNLSSKGRIAAPFDHYLVWSELMRDELLHFYPDVNPEQVHVVGTPQFDPYADTKLLWSREEFFRQIGGDPTRPLICYSGGDSYTCPEDQEHVRVLMELIHGGRIKDDPQVVLRPAPVDGGSRYDKVRKLFPDLIYSAPVWAHTKPGDWSRSVPLPEDVQLLANLTHHSDMNVNMGSTMTLDFSIHDKPVVNVAFDVAQPPSHGVPLWDFVRLFDHYRPVIEFGTSRFARSEDEYAEHVNTYLENPALDREGRRKFVDLEVSGPLGQASSRIVETLEQIAR